MQNRKFTYKCFDQNIHSYADIINQLLCISDELKNTNLQNLQSFNISFFVLTKNIFEKTGIGYFENERTLEKLQIQSSKLYFSALKNYVDRVPCSFAWKECFEQCEQNRTWQFVYMAMGMNAHVNNDLAFALKDNVETLHFKNDYDKLNEVISASIKEIVQNLHEKEETVDGFEKKLLIIYSIFLNVIIRRWRNDAWDNFINLKNGYIRAKYVERNAQNILKQILGVTYFRQFFSKNLSKLELFNFFHNHRLEVKEG